MKKETLKTFTLSFLILLSLALTWGLWSYQPKYDFAQNTRLTQSVTIGDTKDVEDVIEPVQMIIFDGKSYKGTINQNEILPINRLLKEWSLQQVEAPVADVNRKELPEKLPESAYIEMKYPVSVPSQVFGELFDMEVTELKMDYIDRIFIPFMEETGDNQRLFLYSTKEEVLAEASLDKENYHSFISAFQKDFEPFTKMNPVEIGNNDLLFLPAETLQSETTTYSTQNISILNFRNALFTEPSLARQYRTNSGEESYTDGAQALEVFYSENRLRFVNPSQELYNMEPGDVILNSIDFINDHAGWTDTYVFYHYDQTNQSTSFRLIVDGFPVFNTPGTNFPGSIKETWRNHEIYEYSRSLVDLRFAIQNQRKQVKLPSGEMLLAQLEKQIPDFSLELLKTAVIGYSSINQNSILVTFEPSWFVLYDGEWQKVTNPIRGGVSNGLE